MNAKHSLDAPIRALTNTLIFLTLLIGNSGCASKVLMVRTPTLFLDSAINPFVNVPEAEQSSKVNMFYATDRRFNVIDYDEGPVLFFSKQRSHSLSFGTCTVEFGNNTPWEDIVAASRVKKRAKKIGMTVVDVKELFKFPATNTPSASFADVDTQRTKNYLQSLEIAEHDLHRVIEERLIHTERKEVFLFIHGVKNSFDNAAYGMATLWHFLGKQGVPIFYSWPASRDAKLVRGYTYDRESSEFTVLHLKQFIRSLATTPELEKIHFIAHSRGADILTAALRELNLDTRDTLAERRKRLKIGNILLSAADIDFEVFEQRILAENILKMPERMVMYISKTDEALKISDWLFSGLFRLGSLDKEGMSPEYSVGLKKNLRLEIINVNLSSSTGYLGHGYFLENPDVLSDVILYLRDNKYAGKENGRPLEMSESGIWQLNDNYPRENN